MGSGFDQPAVLVVVLVMAVRPPSPPPREDSLGAVDRPKGVLELERP